MRKKLCSSCGKEMRHNGKTSAGRTRYRCDDCGDSFTDRRNSITRKFKTFLAWLTGPRTEKEQATSPRTFRRLKQECWKYWPISLPVTTTHPVIFVDGIHLGRQAVVLIARTHDHTLAWHVARTESAQGWKDLFSRLPAPQVLVCDGGTGIESAVAACWPDTKIQRCTYHISAAIRRYTTRRPRLAAGIELLDLANTLATVETPDQATKWLLDYNQWCTKWHTFLKQRSTLADGRVVYTHDRLRSARTLLNKVVKNGTLFRFCDPDVQVEVDFDWRTTNCAESFNAKLRRMFDRHRGMPLTHRIKAIGWMCYLDQENPMPIRELLKILPTDEDIQSYYRDAARIQARERSHYDTGLVWEEFHL